MKTLFTIIFTIIVLITYTNNGNGIRYPFDPNNLLITEMVCIGFVSLFLSVQQNSSQIKGKFLTNTFIRAVPAALCLVAAIGLNYIFRYTGNFLDFTSTSGVLTEADELGFKTLNSLSMTFVAIGVAYNCCLPVFPLSDKQCRFRFIGFCLAILIIVLMIFGLGNMPATSDKYHSLCEQLVGIDYHYLNKTMWLLLFIYLTGFSSLLSVLVRLAESTFGVGKPIFQLKKPDVEQPKIINHDMVSIEEKKAEAKKNV